MSEPKKQYVVSVLTANGIQKVSKTAVSRWHAIELVYQDLEKIQPNRTKYKCK